MSGLSSSPPLTRSLLLLPRLEGRSRRSKSADLQSGARVERAEGRLQPGEAMKVGRGWSDACGSECSGTAERTLRQAPGPLSALTWRKDFSFLAQGRPLVAVVGRARKKRGQPPGEDSPQPDSLLGLAWRGVGGEVRGCSVASRARKSFLPLPHPQNSTLLRE